MVDNNEFPEGDDLSGVKKRNVPVFGQGNSTLVAAGGEAGVQQLVTDFYHYIDSLPEAATIRAMHSDDLSESRQKLATFLIGWMGGEDRYVERYGRMNLAGAHRHMAIGQDEKQAWLMCMQKALDAQPYDELLKRFIMVQLSFPAEMCRNRN
ncbi:globin [Photobacterium kishitanii]|uniref:Globin n=1 Tax=Photobacterium kishitanii TaxID=318456 RepID=A0A2T3KP67_9GAMM|nr:group II truncated hemoglobin [Photobacterium kishitanii]KJG11426.1 globin [Photobacterium kishitanii]KJG56708.1 globin [Photobacterium kishitanii]KJG62519.1 globin [Photobacterium kishitanii]KJG66887.1 globin [Photobacterium kishitanii]KJG70769.1 globin [Photobacterium kishitanii]